MPRTNIRLSVLFPVSFNFSWTFQYFVKWKSKLIEIQVQLHISRGGGGGAFSTGAGIIPDPPWWFYPNIIYCWICIEDALSKVKPPANLISIASKDTTRAGRLSDKILMMGGDLWYFHNTWPLQAATFSSYLSPPLASEWQPCTGHNVRCYHGSRIGQQPDRQFRR